MIKNILKFNNIILSRSKNTQIFTLNNSKFYFARLVRRKNLAGEAIEPQNKKNNQKPSNLDKIKREHQDLQDHDIESQQISQMLKDEAHEEQLQNQKLAQLEKRIDEHMYNDDLDEQLETSIAQKIAEGKSNQQIMEELIGTRSSQSQKKFQRNEEFENKFDSMKAINKTTGQESDFRQNPFINNEMSKELDAFQQYKSIVDDNPDLEQQVGEIPQEPLWKYKQSNKLSAEEKEDIRMNLATLKDNIMTPGMTQDKYKKMDETEKYQLDILQEGDENRLSKLEQRELLEKINEQGLQQYSNIIGQNDKPKSALDLKMEYLQDSNKKDNEEFKDLILSDRDEAFEIAMYNNEKEKREDRALDRKMELDSFGRQDKQLQKILGKRGLTVFDDENMEEYGAQQDQIELYQDIQKEALFAKIKVKEEDEKYQKYLKKKEKIKEFRKYEKQLNENMMKDNLDYNKETEKIPNKILKDKELGIIDTDHIDKLNKMEENIRYDTTKYDFHVIRTENNVREFIEQYFTLESSVIDRLFCGQNCYIQDVYMNPGLTVVYVFWNYAILPTNRHFYMDSKSQIDQNKFEKQKQLEKQIQKHLEKHSKYLSGKLCKELGFKYGPEIRFHKSLVDEKEMQAKDELQKTIPDIVKKMLIEDLNLKKISKKKFNEICERYQDKAMDQLKDTLGNQMHLKEIKGKKPKYEFDENGKRIRNNRTPDGKRKKYVRPNRADKFWDKLEA